MRHVVLQSRIYLVSVCVGGGGGRGLRVCERVRV